MRKFLIVTAFALATPAMAHDCPDKVIAAADHLGLTEWNHSAPLASIEFMIIVLLAR